MQTCPRCSKEFAQTKGRGRPRTYCSDECSAKARKRLPPGKAKRCLACQGAIEAKGPWRYCSEECKVSARTVDLVCEVCVKPFRSLRAAGSAYTRRTCSPACMGRLMKASCIKASATRRTPRPPRLRPCADCAVQVSTTGPVPLCRPCAKSREKAAWQAKNRRRRAWMRGGSSEPYTLTEIAERDRFRCRLCRRRVDMSIKAPNSKSPTIDHVVPLAEGGDDTRANVQLAHFGCNSSKGTGGSQQLALVG